MSRYRTLKKVQTSKAKLLMRKKWSQMPALLSKIISKGTHRHFSLVSLIVSRVMIHVRVVHCSSRQRWATLETRSKTSTQMMDKRQIFCEGKPNTICSRSVLLKIKPSFTLWAVLHDQSKNRILNISHSMMKSIKTAMI